jgi:hypothetical protein
MTRSHPCECTGDGPQRVGRVPHVVVGDDHTFGRRVPKARADAGNLPVQGSEILLDPPMHHQ